MLTMHNKRKGHGYKIYFKREKQQKAQNSLGSKTVTLNVTKKKVKGASQ